MAATLEQQRQEAFRLANFNILQANISAFLAEYIVGRDVLSLSDFGLNPVLDLVNFKRKITSDADFAGINFFAPYCEKLILPNMGAGSTLPQGRINVSEFKKLKVLSCSGDVGWQAFEGDLSTLTTLEEVNFVFQSTLVATNGMKMPVMSANPNLKKVNIIGSGLPSIVSIANCGNLQSNLQLQEYSLTYFNASTAPLRAIIDNILSSAKALKLAGGVLQKIVLTATPAPTGGAANADAVWLAANGVTVTLGTL